MADYVELLARMDAAVIQPALREDKLSGAPKKARNGMICSRAGMPAQVHGITCEPLVLVLLRLGPSPACLAD